MADQGVVIAFEADADSGNQQQQAAGQQRLLFASSTSAALAETSGAGRHVFFRTRKLQRVAEAF